MITDDDLNYLFLSSQINYFMEDIIPKKYIIWDYYLLKYQIIQKNFTN